MEPVSRISKYEVGRKLGQGGFGEIYVARDTELDREIAIKVLRAEHTQRTQLVQRFLQEARAAARINHPGIVTVFECGQTDAGVVFIAMELLAGETLAARIKREQLPLPIVIAFTRQLASALAAAHASGIIHRDLKPQNVFLVPDPAAVAGVRVKVLDFGIAKLSDTLGSNVQTHSMEMMGTPLYMSPEQCKSSATVDARSDIYALGCILFELLSGRTPFEGDAGELIAKHQLVAPPQLHELVAGVPPELERLVAAMLAKSPADRPQTMTAIVDALDAIPPTGTLTRLAVPVAEVQFAPTLAPGGTMTDPRAAQHAPTTPFGGGMPLAPVTPATAQHAPVPTEPVGRRGRRRLDPKRRTRAILIVLGSISLSTGIAIAIAFAAHGSSTTTTDPPPAPTPPSPTLIPQPPAPPAPPKVTDDDDDDDHDDSAGSAMAASCQAYLQASVEAGLRGDQAASEKAALALASCESAAGDLARSVVGNAVSKKSKQCGALVEAGTDAEASGDHKKALAKLEAAYACKHDPHTLMLVVIAACNDGNAAHAKRWWPKLTPDDREKLAPVCARNHVDVE